MSRGHVLSQWQKALHLFELKRYEDAKDIVIDTLPSDFLEAQLLNLLIRCHFGLNENEKAKSITESAIASYPEDPQFLAQYAFCFHLKDDYKNALKYINQAVELQPDNVTYLAFFASVHLELKNLDRAESILVRAEQLDPNDLEVINERIRLAFLKNDNPLANTYINRGLELDPNNAHFIMLKSNVLMDKTEMKEAEATALQALSMDPNNESARKTLLNVLKNKNRLLRFFVGNAFGRFQIEWTVWTVIWTVVAWKAVLLWGGFAILYMLVTWYGGVLFNTLTRLNKKYKLLLNKTDIHQSNFFIALHLILGLIFASQFVVHLLGEHIFAFVSVTLTVMLVGISYFELEEKSGRLGFLIFAIIYALIVYTLGTDGESMLLGLISTVLLLIYGFFFSLRIIFK